MKDITMSSSCWFVLRYLTWIKWCPSKFMNDWSTQCISIIYWQIWRSHFNMKKEVNVWIDQVICLCLQTWLFSSITVQSIRNPSVHTASSANNRANNIYYWRCCVLPMPTASATGEEDEIMRGHFFTKTARKEERLCNKKLAWMYKQEQILKLLWEDEKNTTTCQQTSEDFYRSRWV